MKKPKLLHLSEGCIEYLTKKAAEHRTLFKPFAETVLENMASKDLVTKDIVDERVDTN